MPYPIAGEDFKTKQQLTERCRTILAATPDGESVASEHLAFLFDRFRHRTGDASAEFSVRVSPPALINALCDWAMRVDETILKLGFTLPVGGSLLAVARRRR